jgi:hypothetical protein
VGLPVGLPRGLPVGLPRGLSGGLSFQFFPPLTRHFAPFWGFLTGGLCPPWAPRPTAFFTDFRVGMPTALLGTGTGTGTGTGGSAPRGPPGLRLFRVMHGGKPPPTAFLRHFRGYQPTAYFRGQGAFKGYARGGKPPPTAYLLILGGKEPTALLLI